jgi:hypothetical protein
LKLTYYNIFYLPPLRDKELIQMGRLHFCVRSFLNTQTGFSGKKGKSKLSNAGTPRVRRNLHEEFLTARQSFRRRN